MILKAQNSFLQAAGIPVPDISFKLGDEDVLSEVTSETRDNNTRVAHVSVSQAGTYTCLAVNMYGNDRWVIHILYMKS